MRTGLLICALLGGAVPACSVADFDIDQDIMEQQVMGSPLPGPLATLFPFPLSIDLAAKIKEMNTGPIDSVTLSSLQLVITKTDEPSGDTDDWSFVESIHVFVKSTKQDTTLPRIEIADVSNPGKVTTMKFHVDSKVNIDPYINEGSMVEAESSGTVPMDDVSYNGKAVFTVHPL